MTMTNALAAENAAVEALERALTAAGWADGWDLEDDEVRAADKPLFYRDYTSAAAEEARVEIDGQQHNLYTVYRVYDVGTFGSANRPHHYIVQAALTVYYDDPALLTGRFGALVENLMIALQRERFSVDLDGDSSTLLASDGQPYGCRKTIIATKAVI